MKTLNLSSGNSNYSFEDTLGGEKFRFEIWWNDIAEACFISIFGLTNDFETRGRMLTVGVDLFYPYRVNYGALVLFGPLRERPTLDTLGDTFRLVWISEAEKLAS